MGSGEEQIFWLIHIFIGLMLPFFMFSGCCRRQEEEEAKQND
jgi:hypothetical protein